MGINMKKFKFESILGMGLLTLAILGFILSVILSLPKDDKVAGRAETLPSIPDNLFSKDNQLTKDIQSLTVPTNIPVKPNQANIGRVNVFESY